jgi:Acetyl-CoA hydrolase/transferase C-terminal domain
MIYSGFGGQTDSVVGALHSPGGRAIIALPSWHPKADVSTVVPRLAGPVTSFQHSFIVSEQGTATICGHDAGEQAAQIIDGGGTSVRPGRSAQGSPRFRIPAAVSNGNRNPPGIHILRIRRKRRMSSLPASSTVTATASATAVQVTAFIVGPLL